MEYTKKKNFTPFTHRLPYYNEHATIERDVTQSIYIEFTSRSFLSRVRVYYLWSDKGPSGLSKTFVFLKYLHKAILIARTW